MFAFIGNIGPWELIFILVIALIVVGPGKLPEVAKSMGKAAREFKKATSGAQKEFQDVMKFDDKPLAVSENREKTSSSASIDEAYKTILNKNESNNPVDDKSKVPE